MKLNLGQAVSLQPSVSAVTVQNISIDVSSGVVTIMYGDSRMPGPASRIVTASLSDLTAAQRTALKTLVKNAVAADLATSVTEV